jgi:iron complex outermembrane recepter protein
MIPLSIIIALSMLPRLTEQKDTVRVIDAKPVEVYAEQCSEAYFTGAPSTSTRSIDELMLHGSAALITRAAMAGEPMIRGLRGGQIMMTIDGMKIHAACVDRMDPISAYVELNNLQTLEVTSGTNDLRYGSNIGGALSFTLQPPSTNAPFMVKADASYDVNSSLRQLRARIEANVDQWSMHASYTFRAAEDLHAGGRSIVAHSNFEKHNASASLNYSFSSGLTNEHDHEVMLQAIVDVAPYIGYPGLLMDTRGAQGTIGALTWRTAWSDEVRSSVKVYANIVDHMMDDLSRSVREIEERPFMPNMRMPMHGRSQTVGLLTEARWILGTGLLNATLDLTHLTADADMDMIPLDTSVTPMHMTNIGDARIGTYGLSITWESVISSDWVVKMSSRLDVSPRTLANPGSRSILEAYHPGSSIDRTLFAGSVSAGLSYAVLDGVTSTLTVSSMERLPTHIESYGFWIYDPQSNFVTIGDPGLMSERAWGADLRWDVSTHGYQGRVSFFGQVIDRYIAAIPYDGGQTDQSSPQVRSSANIGQVVLAGAEVSFNMSIADEVVLGGSFSYVHGEALDVRDPLPLIAPFQGMMRCIFGDRIRQVEVRARGAAAQYRTSTFLQPENSTASWITFDAIATWVPLEHLTVVASLLNITDLLYHEHTSINDIPSRGRSFMLTIRTQW